MPNNNPFKEGSTQYRDFEVMSDLQWHCTKCELASGQAKTWQVWRQEKGIQLKMDGEKYYKTMHCDHCGCNTIHRGLASLEIITEGTRARASLPKALTDRVKKHYDNIDAFTLRVEAPGKLEVDHRFPQVRWTTDEDVNDIHMSEEEIENKFMLLTRENNLLKSRFCENCKNTGKRAKGYGIPFWYVGGENWDDNIGCEGCFWFSPEKWRAKVKEILARNGEDNNA